MPIGLTPNVSSNYEDPHNSVYTNRNGSFERGSYTVTVCISVVIASSVLVLCALLCCREVRRRRRMFKEDEEKARREFVRQYVRLKLQELEHLTDSASISEQSETKIPLVTFGDVVTISPAHSPVLQQRTPTPKYTRHQNEYYFLHQSYLNVDGKRRVNHIPSRPINRQLSYRHQQQMRDVQRHTNGYHSPNHRQHKVQSIHNNYYKQPHVTSPKHINNGDVPTSTGDTQHIPSRNARDDDDVDVKRHYTDSRPSMYQGHLV